MFKFNFNTEGGGREESEAKFYVIECCAHNKLRPGFVNFTVYTVSQWWKEARNLDPVLSILQCIQCRSGGKRRAGGTGSNALDRVSILLYIYKNQKVFCIEKSLKETS